MAAKLDITPSTRCPCVACKKTIEKGSIRFGFCGEGANFNNFAYEHLACVTKIQAQVAKVQHGTFEKIPGFKALGTAQEETLSALQKKVNFKKKKATTTVPKKKVAPAAEKVVKAYVKSPLSREERLAKRGGGTVGATV
ncbi:hypothetical protein BDR26DRAFT_923744 [Obelidium mucronatum]|nr:hypothetical protein BDR26DRAFT_923744 [Obelidium mucronatum]